MVFPKLNSPVLLSPMAGVTDVAFRALAKQYGAGLTYTEFISSTAIVRGNKKTASLLVTDPSEKPVAVQLFGSSVEDVVGAAKAIEHQFDIIDVNCGCPAWKVIKTGAGSQLLKKPEQIGRFISKLSSAVSKPVTVKIRTGIDDRHINAVDVAKIAEDNGAAALAIHGRTQQQGYRGEANWDIIKKVKDSISIPVIGNGDVFTPEVFKQRQEESGVDFIMIARGAMNNPYLISQINQYLKKGTYDEKDKLSQFNDFMKFATKHDLDFQLLKHHAMNFTKGIEGGAKKRSLLSTCHNKEQVLKVMNT